MTRPNPKPHTAYKVLISTPVRTWDVWRRYSDFESLAGELKSETGKEVDGEGLPGKHPWSFRSSVNDTKVSHPTSLSATSSEDMITTLSP
jgi:regulator of vacuolar morphogenesis